MANSVEKTTKPTSMVTPNELPIWVLASQGIKLLINNQPEEAQKLFSKYPNDLIMFCGHSYTIFLDALMSFEEDKLALAISTLKELEKRCATESGWLKSLSSKVFGSDNKSQKSLAEEFETQIILADSQVCIAILMCLQNDISSYIKAGWILRKSWKVYQRSYKELLALYKERIGELQLPDPQVLLTTTETTDNLLEHQNVSASLQEWEIPETLFNGRTMTLEKEEIIRLMGAVSFGYGLFLLGVSFLPPNLMRITSILGFTSNRQIGISCLMYSRLGVDMRAPLARLALLWYHTIVRPFYAIDGSNVQAGVDASWMLLKESEAEFSESALFSFFRGRACRLNSDIPSALEAFEQTVNNSTQRELKLLSLHEVGWCHLIELNYRAAETTFLYLSSSSRWSKAFYAYISAICTGSSENELHLRLCEDLKNGISGFPKIGQLEDFLNKRIKRSMSDLQEAANKPTIYWQLLVLEMLYLWNTLPSCSREVLDTIITDCNTVTEESQEPMLGISKFILGCTYCVVRKYEDGIENFRKCLALRKNTALNADDAHISAFCLYELGSQLLKSEETKNAGKQHLLEVGQYSKYDFDHKLNIRVFSLLKSL